MREGLRGALLSVLVLGLVIGGTPVPVMASNDDTSLTFSEIVNVVDDYVPLPRIQVDFTPRMDVMGGSMGPNIQISIPSEAINRQIRKWLRQETAQVGRTPEQICSWYRESYQSKEASAARIALAVMAIAVMYMDLTEDGDLLSPKLSNLELKNQLTGILMLAAAGGHGDQIIRDTCNIAGYPI